MSEPIPDCVARWGPYFPQGEDPDMPEDMPTYGMTDEEEKLAAQRGLTWLRCRQAGQEPPIDAATGLIIPECFIVRDRRGRVLRVGDQPDVGPDD